MKSSRIAVLSVFAVLVVLVAVLSAPALSRDGRSSLSLTRAFSIDGKRFRVLPSAMDDLSLIRRELSRHGVKADLPDGADTPGPLPGEALEAAGKTGEKEPAAIPPGLAAEHSLGLDAESGPVNIVFGRMTSSGRSVLDGLRAAGWEIRPVRTAAGAAEFASITKGRETCVVFLDEEKREFLLLRRVGE